MNRDPRMNQAVPFTIDLTKSFPHLPRAPIVEAVIHWQARATQEWRPEELQKTLAERLPDYPSADLQHCLELAFVSPPGGESKPIASRRETWHGVRLQSADKLHIAQFTRDGLAFSRLQPYEDWERFTSEARRLWKVFIDLAAPSEIQRLGVRFINRIGSAGFGNLREYLNELPTFEADLTLSGFFYQSTFDVPGNNLGINLVKMMQPAIPGQVEASGLIIDIDVFTKSILTCDDRTLDEYLPRMRWLKNKVFYDLLTPNAISSFQ